jgi:bifunctional DNA-binding transcriptional regulator/antitoxin component of YhaV-PrlF toxin-antitoxin module
MEETATITSKRQLTIPISIFRKAKLKEGQKVLIKKEGGVINIQPVTALVEKLAGSVITPKRFKGKTPEEILAMAKREYFNTRSK